MQVVIPEDDRCGIAHRADPPQRLQRFGTPIDDIADEPKPVALRRETDRFEQRPERGVAALNIADSIEGHAPCPSVRRSLQCRTPGIASRKGAIGASKCCPSS